jgi:inner membrane protein
MMAPTHVMIGVAAYAAAAVAAPALLPLTPATIGAAALGSLAPDLDHPSSWLGKRLFFISIPLATFLGHRGLTHSLLAGAAVTVALGWYFFQGSQAFIEPWLGAFLLGYLSHLLGDWNTGGVPLLWPSPRRFKAPWAFPTGGILERAFAVGLGLVLSYGGWSFIKEYGIGRFL